MDEGGHPPAPPTPQFCPTNAAFHEFAEYLGFDGNNPVAQLLSSASQDPAMLASFADNLRLAASCWATVQAGPSNRVSLCLGAG